MIFGFHIPPSAYDWLIPDVLDIRAIDEMALVGTFPTLLSLYPSVIFAILFGIIRSILQVVLFKVSISESPSFLFSLIVFVRFDTQPVAVYCMKLKFSEQKSVKVIDQVLKSMKGVKDKVPVRIPRMPLSHSFLHTPLSLFQDEVNEKLAEESGLSKVEVKKYIWNRNRDEVNHRKVVKFGEAMWRSMFYTSFCLLGVVTLCFPTYVPWLLDTSENFNNWPHHPISALMNFYYQIELGCYIHQLHWTEVNRSDALEMIIHHVVTIGLIVGSYMINFTRVGTSILLCHDFADIFLEIGKCFNYTSKTPQYKAIASPITDFLFVCFSVSFLVTRLIIYPRFLLYSMVVESPRILGMWSGYWYFAILLCSLQVLHVFWFYLILKMAYRIMIVGEVEKDVRSDDDDVPALAQEEEKVINAGDKKQR